MHKAMKTTLAVLASLALIPAAATAAYRVGSPFPGTVVQTTYYSSGSFHGAVDISSGANCNYWGVETGVVGSLFWDVTLRNTATCYTDTTSAQNEVKHVFANNDAFRIWHFLKSATSVDKTCDRCEIGKESGMGSLPSNRTHMQYDRMGTLLTSWYSSYTTRGEFLDRGETVGYLP